MKKLSLAVQGQKQNLFIGAHALSELGKISFFSKEKQGKAFIIADDFFRLDSKKIEQRLQKIGWVARSFFVKANENLKDFREIYPLYGKLLKEKADRHSIIIALGGGVIGDVAGFIAGTYMRGIRWVSVPTSLVSQVDSGMGGKTGVNHEFGKNLIGVFHHPSVVICDTSFLSSLSQRDRVSGLGEMIKYGLTFDPHLFQSLQKNWKSIVYSPSPQIETFIYRCLQWKCEKVSQDPEDRNGIREVLNFGHTFGHALEAVSGYGYFRHGEAVIWGMRAAIQLSVLNGNLKAKSAKDLELFLSSLPVPGLPDHLKKSNLLKSLQRDKKSRAGKIRFVLLRDIGQATLDPHVPDFKIAEVAQWLLERKSV